MAECTITRLLVLGAVAGLLLARPGFAQSTHETDMSPAAKRSGGAVILGEKAGDETGISVAGVGDVNGDGFDDVLIGAIDARHEKSGGGAAYLFYGGEGEDVLTGQLSTADADAVFTGYESSDDAGWPVAAAGDVNGDGYDDLLIGARDASRDGNSDTGEAYLIYGGGGDDAPTGEISLSEADAIFRGIDGNDHAASSLAGGGDLNGDGFDDFVITSQGDHAGYLFYGGADDKAPRGLHSLKEADAVFQKLAFSNHEGNVAINGDINHDGYDDLIISAPMANAPGIRAAGEVYLFYGGAGDEALAGRHTSADADATMYGRYRSTVAGRPVAFAGDVNGDKVDDLVIGTGWVSMDDNRPQETYLVYGATGDRAPAGRIGLDEADAMFNGTESLTEMGWRAGTAGDLNHDGLNDLMISSVGASPGGREHAGAVCVVYGERTPASKQAEINHNNIPDGLELQWQSKQSPRNLGPPDVQWNGDEAAAQAGNIASAGDVNGDGLDDILIGADGYARDGQPFRGRAYLIYGSR